MLRWFVTVLIFAGSVLGWGQPKLWGDLKAGAYRVGFKSYWSADPTRTFPLESTENRPPRPVLVEVWYPASHVSSHPMVEGDYLDFVPPSNSGLDSFVEKLVEKNRETISDDVVGKPLKDLDAKGQAALAEFLKTETAAFRDADPAPGRFPVVVYIQGYGSSLQDNSSLCEYLAGNGYVVLGSAYQADDLHMIAGRDTVSSDVGWLLGLARRMPNADLSKVALVGHSGGGQSSMVYASREDSMVDAVVTLDTTQDYYFTDRAIFATYLADVNPEALRVPLLAAADEPAIFDFVDSIAKSERTYLTVDRLGHEEYTSEGLAACMAQGKATEGAVRERYTSLCEYVAKFLDVKLKAASADGLSQAPPHFAVQLAPRGTTGPEPYRENGEPPTPRQFRVLVEVSPAKALSLLQRFVRTHPEAPLFEDQLAFAVLDHLLEKKDVAMAKKFLAVYRLIPANKSLGAPIYITWGKIFFSGYKAEAIRCYEKALLFDPKNKEAKAKLAELRDTHTPSP